MDGYGQHFCVLLLLSSAFYQVVWHPRYYLVTEILWSHFLPITKKVIWVVPTSTFFFAFNYRYTDNPGSKNQFPSHTCLEVLSKPLLCCFFFFFPISLPSISCLFQENLFSYHVWFFPSSPFLDCKMKFVRNKSECLDVPRNILEWCEETSAITLLNLL